MAESLAHSKWVCKYHIVFTPKYRRKMIYNELLENIKEIIKDLCKWKGMKIIEGHMMSDHVHLLLSIPPKYSISSVMGYLKGKSAMDKISLKEYENPFNGRARESVQGLNKVKASVIKALAVIRTYRPCK